MKRGFWIGGGVVAVALIAWALSDGEGIVVDTAEVRRDRMSVTVAEEGRTRVRDRYVIAAPVTGRVSRIDLDPGDALNAGDVVARMAPPPNDTRTARSAQADLAVAVAQVAEAGAALEAALRTKEQAAREYERRIPLHEMGAISRESLERARQQAETAAAAHLRAEAALEAARSAERAARARLIGSDAGSGDFSELVTTPVSGVVLHVLEESERVVPAGAPLVEVSGPEGLEFVVDLLTEQAVRVSPGDAAVITGWGEDRPLEGRVRYVEPAAFTEISALGVEEQRVDVVGDLLDPPPGLGVGFRLDVAIEVWAEPDVLVVPTSALFRSGPEWLLFVVEGGRARRRTVEIGQRGTDVAQVLSGVAEGDRVILFPSDRVAEGARVESRGG
jgi:HlyD family secretion protein